MLTIPLLSQFLLMDRKLTIQITSLPHFERKFSYLFPKIVKKNVNLNYQTNCFSICQIALPLWCTVHHPNTFLSQPQKPRILSSFYLWCQVLTGWWKNVKNHKFTTTGHQMSTSPHCHIPHPPRTWTFLDFRYCYIDCPPSRTIGPSHDEGL